MAGTNRVEGSQASTHLRVSLAASVLRLQVEERDVVLGRRPAHCHLIWYDAVEGAPHGEGG
jgi:hypothetical protein